MIKVKLSGRFRDSYRALVEGDSDRNEVISRRIEIFRKNPDDSRLENHALRVPMKGLWSFSIEEDLRIIYKKIGVNAVRFVAIGAHRDVYGGKS